MSHERSMSHAEIDQTAKQISDDFTKEFKSPRGDLQPLIDDLQEQRARMCPAQYRELINNINGDLKGVLPGVTIVGMEERNGQEVLNVYRNPNPKTPANYANQLLTGGEMDEMRRMAPLPPPIPHYGEHKGPIGTVQANKPPVSQDVVKQVEQPRH